MSSRRRIMAFGALALGAAAAAGLFLLPGSKPAEPFAFTTASIALPFDDTPFPEAPGVDAVRAHCAGCHSARMILSQPKLTPAQWQAEVDKMQKAYHAPVDAKAVPAILGYLTGLRGP